MLVVRRSRSPLMRLRLSPGGDRVVVCVSNGSDRGRRRPKFSFGEPIEAEQAAGVDVMVKADEIEDAGSLVVPVPFSCGGLLPDIGLHSHGSEPDTLERSQHSRHVGAEMRSGRVHDRASEAEFGGVCSAARGCARWLLTDRLFRDPSLRARWVVATILARAADGTVRHLLGIAWNRRLLR
jgi:hypothetical protein